jgi:hypothetical protein
MLRQRSISSDQLGSGNEIEGSRGQHRHVQGLADVAGVFGATRVLVEQAAARREIQQHGTSQYSERPARHGSPEYSSAQLH